MTKLQNVVFTGVAQDRMGNTILREDLKAFAEKSGYLVQNAISRTTDLLVASRNDTVKARKAQEAGIPVVDYSRFLGHNLGVHSVPSTGAKPNPFTDECPARYKPQPQQGILFGDEL